MADRTCSIEDCDNPHYGRGWCQKHYGCWYETGSPVRPLQPRRANLPGEQWLPVPGYGGAYLVSSLGRVWSNHRGGRMRKQHKKKKGGYGEILLALNGTMKMHLAHQLVALAFIGPRPKGQQVRHLDGNPQNNALSNLAYGTGSENVHDSLEHGTQAEARKTHCPARHPYDNANTYIEITRDGRRKRKCRKCRVVAVRKAQAKKRAAVRAAQDQ